MQWGGGGGGGSAAVCGAVSVAIAGTDWTVGVADGVVGGAAAGEASPMADW